MELLRRRKEPKGVVTHIELEREVSPDGTRGPLVITKEVTIKGRTMSEADDKYRKSGLSEKHIVHKLGDPQVEFETLFRIEPDTIATKIRRRLFRKHWLKDWQ